MENYQKILGEALQEDHTPAGAGMTNKDAIQPTRMPHYPDKTANSIKDGVASP